MPEDVAGRPKWRLASDEIDCVLAAEVRFAARDPAALQKLSVVGGPAGGLSAAAHW
jgi:hypothetical protein